MARVMRYYFSPAWCVAHAWKESRFDLYANPDSANNEFKIIILIIIIIIIIA